MEAVVEKVVAYCEAVDGDLYPSGDMEGLVDGCVVLWFLVVG